MIQTVFVDPRSGGNKHNLGRFAWAGDARPWGFATVGYTPADVLSRLAPSAILPGDWPPMVYAGFPSFRNMHARDKGASARQHFPGRFV